MGKMVFDQVYHQLSIFELNIDICICLARYCHGSLPHFDYAFVCSNNRLDTAMFQPQLQALAMKQNLDEARQQGEQFIL